MTKDDKRAIARNVIAAFGLFSKTEVAEIASRFAWQNQRQFWHSLRHAIRLATSQEPMVQANARQALTDVIKCWHHSKKEA